jgi:hypothetical protein
MRSSPTELLPANFNGNPPAADEGIKRVEAVSGLDLPRDYEQFLRQTNGGEGFIGNAYAIFWRGEELLEFPPDLGRQLQ